MRNEKIGVLGLTHLGCVLAASWSKIGYTTIGVDLEEEVVLNLQKGVPPIFEPDLEAEMQKAFLAKTLFFSHDLASLAAADFIFLGYDTEVDENDAPDTSLIEKRICQIGPILKEEAVVIISSQVPAGYSEHLRKILQKCRPSLELVYSPENLQLGQAIACYLNPGRIILGAANPKALKKTAALFSAITNNVKEMSLESAEIVKHGINAFLATSIVFSNALADVCEQYPAAAIFDVIEGIKSDARIGPKAYLSPGIGFSGGTLGRDVRILSGLLNENNFFETVYEKNRQRKGAIIEKIKKIVPLKGQTVAVLGVTYKPGTSTLRRSLPLEIASTLSQEGAIIQLFDPKADYSSLKEPLPFLLVDSIEKAAAKADLLLLLTEWPEFKQFNFTLIKETMRSPLIFDAKNALDGKKLSEAGFSYWGIGELRGKFYDTSSRRDIFYPDAARDQLLSMQ